MSINKQKIPLADMGNGDCPARQKHLDHDKQCGFDDIIPCPGIGPNIPFATVELK